jgi:hypothetical protein
MVLTVMITHRTSRAHIVGFGAALLLACMGLASVPVTAQASAYGCTTSGAGLPWYGLNSAYTCIDVGGSGDTVWMVQPSWMGIGTICNYRFQVRFFDDRGRRYETDTSPLHVGCRAAAANWTRDYGARNMWGGYDGVHKRTGEVCAYLIEAGSVRSGVPCEYIHP